VQVDAWLHGTSEKDLTTQETIDILRLVKFLAASSPVASTNAKKWWLRPISRGNRLLATSGFKNVGFGNLTYPRKPGGGISARLRLRLRCAVTRCRKSSH